MPAQLPQAQQPLQQRQQQTHPAAAAATQTSLAVPNSSAVNPDQLSLSLSSLSLQNGRARSASILSDNSAHSPPRRDSMTPNGFRSVSRTSNGSNSKRSSYTGPPSATSGHSRRSSLLGTNDLEPVSHKDKRKLVAPSPDPNAETTVILADSSYKHRWSRPNTSAATISTIVERPERIPACVLGASAAQVRCGPSQLSIQKCSRQGKLSDPEVMLVHSHSGVAKGKQAWPEQLSGLAQEAGEKNKTGMLEVPEGLHAGDLYLCDGSLEDLEGCVGAVYEGVDQVFGPSKTKRAYVCIRPPGHHCAETQPSGFCWINNVHIAITHAAKMHGLTHAVILDFDLHHGDGSQEIAWGINKLAASGSVAAKKTHGIPVPNIAYFSMHDINSYPCEMGDDEKVRNASLNLESHNQFIHNVHLKTYTTTEEFWDLYENHYASLLTKARQFLQQAANSAPNPKQKKPRDFKPGIFISAGFDASEYESPGMQRHKVHVPTSFYARFTADTVALADELCEGRVLSVLEGGYSDKALASGSFAHLCGLTLAPPESNGESADTPPPEAQAWREEWWDNSAIDDLDRYNKKMKNGPAPQRVSTYMAPTTASIARTTTDTPRRVVSGGSGYGSMAPPPPPPQKAWEQNAWELAQCFIPEYAESKPIPAIPKEPKVAKAKGLTAPMDASKRHSIAAPEANSAAPRRSARDRKPISYVDSPSPAKEKNRRQTSGSVMAPPPQAVSRSSSRMGSSRGVSPMPGGAVTSRKPMVKKTKSPPNELARKRSAEPVKPPVGNGNTVDGLTRGVQRINLTYKNADRDRENEKIKSARSSAATSRSASHSDMMNLDGAMEDDMFLDVGREPIISPAPSSGFSSPRFPSDSVIKDATPPPVFPSASEHVNGIPVEQVKAFEGVQQPQFVPHSMVPPKMGAGDNTFRGGEIRFGPPAGHKQQ